MATVKDVARIITAFLDTYISIWGCSFFVCKIQYSCDNLGIIYDKINISNLLDFT